MAQLVAAKEIGKKFNSINGIFGQRLAEVSCASAFLLRHGGTSSK
jgi:hypothetical protein